MSRLPRAAGFAGALLALAAVASGGDRVPGDTMVYKNSAGGPNPLTVKTAPLPTYAFTVRGPQPREIFAIDFNNPATILWGVDNTTREIGRIDVATGAFTPVAIMNPAPPATTFVGGMSFDPTSALVYVSLQDQNGTASLRTIDLVTGASTLVGTLLPGFVGIAIDDAGQMYALNILVNNLYRINKANGSATLVGPTGMTFTVAPMGLDFDPSDGTLYGCVVDGATPPMGHLVSFNLSNGNATILATAEEAVDCAVNVPTTLQAMALAVDTPGNRVLQPNEGAVEVAPTWRNNGTAAAVTGAASAFGGPPGATYTINDGAAAYGTIAAGAQVSCTASGNCYGLSTATAARPAVHWDASFVETLSPAAVAKTWTLHVGDSFTDVPPGNPFYRFIEILLHNGVTGGCTQTTYCPANSTTRDQMAVFVLLSKEGRTYLPPACVAGTEAFNDVPAASPFCRWIEELARRGVVGGCGGGAYCPTSPVTREQMSIFVLKTLDPALVPPPCAPPNLYLDVPETSPFCRWIEELTVRNVVSGCGGGNYCPTASVTREQMGVFLSVTFGLSLYGI